MTYSASKVPWRTTINHVSPQEQVVYRRNPRETIQAGLVIRQNGELQKAKTKDHNGFFDASSI